MTNKEHIMDKLHSAVAGLFLVYGTSTEEDVEEIIIDLLNEAEKQFRFKEQECEELKKRLMQNDEVNTFFNTPIEGWSSDPCGICESKNNYEQLKEDYAELERECEELKERKLKLELNENHNKNEIKKLKKTYS